MSDECQQVIHFCRALIMNGLDDEYIFVDEEGGWNWKNWLQSQNLTTCHHPHFTLLTRHPSLSHHMSYPPVTHFYLLFAIYSSHITSRLLSHTAHILRIF